ncbi:MAG: tRNA pseudouridine(38-40) synthase TruA [Salibacteraceae bacterium]
MNRYFLQLSYDGTAYHGWQMQENALSVQEVINKNLSLLLRKPVNVLGCGRTDTGVHASQFYAHFDAEMAIDAEQIGYKLNRMLPSDIAIQGVLPVQPEAHARFDATGRTYQYLICQQKDPFLIHRAWHMTRSLDVEAMNQAAALLLEYEDFASFSKSNTDVKTYRCEIREAQWQQEGHRLTFTVSANRFLRNMVRALVGTLWKIGVGQMEVEDMRRVIEARNRTEAGPSVPAAGLYLCKIDYPTTLFLKGNPHG